jgi:hydrogenase large subunit
MRWGRAIAMMLMNGAHPAGKELVEKTLRGLQLESSALSSVMGRHLARAIECKLVADSLGDMIMQVKLEEPVCVPHTIPEKGQGMGLWCARGRRPLGGVEWQIALPGRCADDLERVPPG